MPNRTDVLLEELRAALMRLAIGEARRVKPPYRICHKTVCEEAGRDRSSIKTGEPFLEIRAAIRRVAELHDSAKLAPDPRGEEILALTKKLERLSSKLRDSESALDSAVVMIHDLHRELLQLESHKRQLYESLDCVRRANPSIDRELRLAGIDLSRQNRSVDTEL